MNIKMQKSLVSQVEIGLNEDIRTQVGQILAQLLADQHVLYTKLRNYHWNVTGMAFKALHERWNGQDEDQN